MLLDFIQRLRRGPRTHRALPQCGLLLTGLAALMVGSHDATAQTYPNKPLRFMLGFAPGGASDIVARIVGARLSESLGQPVVIDNRPAASGSAAAGMIARSPPDGYTMLLAATSTMAVNPSLYKNLPYDSLKDFTYVANFVSMPNLLVVHPNVAAKSVLDVIALAKAEGGKLAYASAGIGSANHFTASLFSYLAKVKMTHVPYKGGGPAMVDVMAGQVEVLFNALTSALTHIRSGKLKVLAVSSLKRSPVLPDVPAAAETVPGYESVIWWGIQAPAGTPPAIIAKLNSEIGAILRDPGMVKRLEAEAADVVVTSPEVFGKFVADEVAKWINVSRTAGIRAN